MNVDKYLDIIANEMWRRMFKALDTHDVELAYQTSIELKTISKIKSTRKEEL